MHAPNRDGHQPRSKRGVVFEAMEITPRIEKRFLDDVVDVDVAAEQPIHDARHVTSMPLVHHRKCLAVVDGLGRERCIGQLGKRSEVGQGV